MKYCIKRAKGKTFVCCCNAGKKSYINIDEALITAEDFVHFLMKNKIEPAHIECIYEDLLSAKVK